MKASKVLAALAALIMSVLLLGSGSATGQSLDTAQDPPSYPDCDDSIQYTSIAYNASTDTFRYKIVGVDLGRWLKGYRYGKLYHVATSSSHGSQHEGPWTIDSGGFISPLLYNKSSSPSLNVNSWIETNGTVRCQYRTTLKVG